MDLLSLLLGGAGGAGMPPGYLPPQYAANGNPNGMPGQSMYPVAPGQPDPLAPLPPNVSPAPGALQAAQGMPPVSPASPPGGVGMPPPPPGSNLPTPSGTQPQDPNAPISVVGQGDTWHPHKRSLLGTIGDFALAALGFPLFPFGKANHEQNIQEAMSKYEANPEQAIARLAQIKGEEFDAAKLAQQQTVDKRYADNLDRQNEIADFNRTKAVQGMLAGVGYSLFNSQTDPTQPLDPNKLAAFRRTAEQLDQSYHTNIAATIPDNPTIYDMDSFAGAEMPAWRQAQLANLQRHQQVMEAQGQQHQDNYGTFVQGVVKNGAANAAAHEQSAEASSENAGTNKGRLNLQTQEFNAKDGVSGMSKYGPYMRYGDRVLLMPFPGVAPPGYDGKGLRYVVVNGTMVPAGKVPGK